MNFLGIKIEIKLYLVFLFSLLFVGKVAGQGDDCGSATALTTNSDATCGSNPNRDNGTLTNDSYGCTGGNTAGFRDGWFSFVATQTTHQINVDGAANFQARVGVYTDCSSTATVTGGGCVSASGIDAVVTLNLSLLIIGNTYYIQVYNATADLGTQNNRNRYTVCVTTPSAPNDACANSVALTHQTNGNCTTTTGSVAGATTSTPTPTCTGTANFDVWYTFTATATVAQIKVVATGINEFVEVFSQTGACTGLTSLGCFTVDGGGTISGLTAGNVYRVRVGSESATMPTAPTFTICITAPPTNDECAGAVTLTHQTNGNCTTTAGTVLDATTSTPTPTCTGTANFDVWYTFTATATIAQINVVAGGINEFVEVFSQTGACTGLTSLGCFTVDGGGIFANLTVGQVYRVRLGAESATAPVTPTFTICITTPPTPANNDCAGAILLTQQAVGVCTTTSGTILGATQSVAPCTGTGNSDVWYRFQATATSAIVSRIAGFDSVVEVFSGACGSLTSISSCQDVETDLTVTGLTIGTFYFVRIYYVVAGMPATRTFDICITSVLTTPPNDNCTGAIAVTHEPFGSCVGTSGTVTNATQSLVGCAGTADDDIWFSFVATSTVADIRVNWSQDEEVEVFSGSCASPTSLVCQDTPEGSVVTSALTIGATYFVRVYSYTSFTATYPSFSICITTTSTATNNNCVNAVSITHSAAGTCNLVAGTFTGATSSLADCSGNSYTVRDVWYTFQATATTALIHRIASVGTIIQIFTAPSTCGALTSLNCSTSSAADIQLAGLTVGSNYLVRIYPASSTAPTDPRFTLCITTPSTISNATCATSAPICGSNTISFQAVTGGSAPVGNNYGCLSTQPAPAWFYLQIATSGSLVFGLEASADVDYAIWGPYNALADAVTACGSFPAPVSCSYNSSKNESATITNALVGQVYVLLITNFANVNQAINLRQLGGTGATACSIVLASELTQLHASAEGTNNTLYWQTVLNTKHIKGFEIQKSLNRRDFTTIKYVARSEALNYSYSESNVECKDAYYQVMVVYQDGMKSPSQVVSVLRGKNDCQTLLQIYPNPAQKKITLLPTLQHQNPLEYVLTDARGTPQQAGKVMKENDKYELDIAHLPKGLYILKAKIANQWVYEKIMKE